MTKSEDDLKQEREHAAEQLAAILQARRPKGLKEGVLSGASNIVTGAIGAAGIAVLAPTVGLSAGMSQGGLLGGILGLTGGVVIGAVGAAAMALGGETLIGQLRVRVLEAGIRRWTSYHIFLASTKARFQVFHKWLAELSPRLRV